jgi:hypothetical protein
MSNLQKFNNTIEEFDKELIKLKDTSEAYQKLQGLVTSYAKINEQFIKNSKSLEEFAAHQQQKQEELSKSLVSLQDENKTGNEEIKKQNESFEKNFSLLIQKLQEENKINKEEVKKQNESFEKNITSLVEKLRKENKDFYLDLEKTVKIKLDENKSEIKQLIESERYKIKEIFETELSKKTDEILSKQKDLQTVFWIMGVILVILNVVVLVKLFQ